MSILFICLAETIQEQGTSTYHPENGTYTVSEVLASGLATDDGGMEAINQRQHIRNLKYFIA